MPSAILICRDLMFTSKVSGTAQALGHQMTTVGTLAKLTEKLAEGTPRAIFLDLTLTAISPADVVAAVPQGCTPHLIAFGPHVDTDSLTAARTAGFETYVRSQFSSGLVEIVNKVFAGP